MKAARLFLARHGAHDELDHILSGRSDIGINAIGRRQAARLAERIAGGKLVAVHSSPRRRAIETATPAALLFGLSVQPVDALDEIDFGAWTGRRFTQLAHDPGWARWNCERSTATTPAGETMDTVVDRAWRHVHAIEEGPVLCVSHGDVIRGLVARALNLPAERFFSIEIHPGSLTTFERTDADLRVTACNEGLS